MTLGQSLPGQKDARKSVRHNPFHQAPSHPYPQAAIVTTNSSLHPPTELRPPNTVEPGTIHTSAYVISAAPRRFAKLNRRHRGMPSPFLAYPSSRMVQHAVIHSAGSVMKTCFPIADEQLPSFHSLPKSEGFAPEETLERGRGLRSAPLPIAGAVDYQQEEELQQCDSVGLDVRGTDAEADDGALHQEERRRIRR